MHDALRDKAGVIIIAGKTPYGEADDSPGGRSGYINWLQDVPDQPGIVRSYAKLVMEITRPEMLDRALGRAVQVATSYPAGPVYLTVSRDVLMDPPSIGESRTAGFAVPAAPAMPVRSLDQVAQLVAGAERPLLITTRLGRRPEGFAAATRLAELAGVTVVRGADNGPVSIPTLHPMHLRSPGTVVPAIRDADLILIVECDVPYIPRVVKPNPEATVVHIDPDPLKLTMPLWSYPVDIGIQADGPTAIEQLVVELERIAKRSSKVAARFAARVTAAGSGEPLEHSPNTDSDAIVALDVMLALNSLLAPEDIVIEEAVTNGRTLFENLVRTLPETIAGPFAPGLGWALGGAIGVKLARPDRRVISICGDGTFLFAVPSSALQMSAQIGAPFLAVVLNNGGYRASRLPVWELFPTGASRKVDDAIGTRFGSQPDFSALAEACHAVGERVERRGDLVDALKRGLSVIEGGRSALIDVKITQS
jgi:acetolactate synthase-1/2/3 large subunit